MKRLVFLDNLKLHLIILVVFHHVLVAYGASGAWPLVDKATDIFSPQIFTMIAAINQSFFMNLFMLLSGFFIVSSLTKKGKGKYIKERLLRLGLPLILYPILIVPVINFIVERFGNGKNVSFFDTFRITWNVGPLWFIEALLIFTIVFVLIRGTKPIVVFKDVFPKNKAIFSSIFVLAILTYIVRIFFPVNKWIYHFMFGHFVVYIFMFFIGIVAYHNNWFEHLNKLKSWRFAWIGAILGFIIINGTMFYGLGVDINSLLGGGTLPSLIFAFWDTSSAFAIILSLLYYYDKKKNKQKKLAKQMSPNSYGTYIFHSVIIILLMAPLFYLNMSTVIKAFIVFPLAVILSFGLTWLIKKIPGVKRVL